MPKFGSFGGGERFPEPKLPEETIDHEAGDITTTKKIERRPQQEIRPNLTVYLMRHGKSTEDKTDPNRGLTELGRNQVRDNFQRLLDQVLAEENPNFDGWDDPEAKAEAMREALQKVEFHLRDSGTYRTQEQEWLEEEMLKAAAGPDYQVYLPKSAYEWKKEQPPKTAGPGIQKHVAGISGLDANPEFRKLLKNKDYQQKVGATDEMVTWALTPEDEIPQGISTRREMNERIGKDLASVDRLAKKRLTDYPKRVIVVANSHASIITLAAAKELGMPLEDLGEVDNGEGLRMDFYAGGTARQTKPFGRNIEEKYARELTG